MCPPVLTTILLIISALSAEVLTVRNVIRAEGISQQKPHQFDLHDILLCLFGIDGPTGSWTTISRLTVPPVCFKLCDASSVHDLDVAQYAEKSLPVFCDWLENTGPEYIDTYNKCVDIYACPELCSLLPANIRCYSYGNKMADYCCENESPRVEHVYCNTDLKWKECPEELWPGSTADDTVYASVATILEGGPPEECSVTSLTGIEDLDLICHCYKELYERLLKGSRFKTVFGQCESICHLGNPVQDVVRQEFQQTLKHYCTMFYMLNTNYESLPFVVE